MTSLQIRFYETPIAEVSCSDAVSIWCSIMQLHCSSVQLDHLQLPLFMWRRSSGRSEAPVGEFLTNQRHSGSQSDGAGQDWVMRLFGGSRASQHYCCRYYPTQWRQLLHRHSPHRATASLPSKCRSSGGMATSLFRIISPSRSVRDYCHG